MASDLLSKNSLTSTEVSTLILSVSGIVNFIDKSMVSVFQNKFPQEIWNNVMEEHNSMSLDKFAGLDAPSCAIACVPQRFSGVVDASPVA
ncbi:hypothetical protein DM01DRAFT_1377819 [Hesseltinella vesiculosa]|uniref:Uncharacterized protein n=1 Tax=Hesseltinella vesiculosa TaxID=101127 RepID=A0A1X2G674_9FUNG|nr:hypothetical protein DM01DRAFT_1377819 [Hesseltinella vesiculosa]